MFWSKVLSIPFILLINGYLAWHYYKRGAENVEDPWRYGPLALQLVGAVLVLIMPVFDKGGLIMLCQSCSKNGLPENLFNPSAAGQAKPPEFFQGGFWHHGYFMAFCQVSGLLCILCAGLWSGGVFRKSQQLLEEQEKRSYGSNDGNP